jgi:hypothetical protein
MPTSARIARFLKHDMWTLDLATLPFPRRLGVHALRLAIAVSTPAPRALCLRRCSRWSRFSPSCFPC